MDLEIEGVTKEELRKHLDQVSIRYFSHSGGGSRTACLNAPSICCENSNTASEIINWRNDVRRALTVIDIITRDQVGLFEKQLVLFQ